MKVALDVKKIRFREGDGDLSPVQQREILARRVAGCSRVVRRGREIDPLTPKIKPTPLFLVGRRTIGIQPECLSDTFLQCGNLLIG